MSQLYVGTTSHGIFALNLSATKLKPIQFLDGLITHISATKNAVAVAKPVLGPVHKMYPVDTTASSADSSGVYVMKLNEDGIPTSSDAFRQVWKGNARSVAIQPHTSRLFVGLEPASVDVSNDLGETWHTGNGFKDVPSRPTWSFPAPPHEPHTLSFEFLPSSALAHNSNNASKDDVAVLAGIEVGGVMASLDNGNNWDEKNQGLYPDVHSCRVDSFDHAHWLVVTGGGLYQTTSAGTAWERKTTGMSGGSSSRYPVGLAFNPEKQGEILMAAGDRPPAIGTHILLSKDGGNCLEDITDAVYSGELSAAKGKITPVPYFLDGNALLGTDTGYILVSRDKERRKWEVLCQLPAPIVCLAAPERSPSSVMH